MAELAETFKSITPLLGGYYLTPQLGLIRGIYYGLQSRMEPLTDMIDMITNERSVSTANNG